MTAPRLDGRSAEDILAEIKYKSEVFTPEWKPDGTGPDGGGALARLFSEMFFETVDRYNRFLDKSYLEFLNMLGVCAAAPLPPREWRRREWRRAPRGACSLKKIPVYLPIFPTEPATSA